MGEWLWGANLNEQRGDEAKLSVKFPNPNPEASLGVVLGSLRDGRGLVRDGGGQLVGFSWVAIICICAVGCGNNDGAVATAIVDRPHETQ